MANFQRIATSLEGVIQTQLTLARTNQGIWEWFNALQKVMSSNRFSGTPKYWGLQATTGATDIDVETAAVTLFGVLIDNSMTAEDCYVSVYNTNTVTAGTTLSQHYWGERNSITTYVIPNGRAYGTAFSVTDSIGTNAGLEAGTLATTPPNVILVYTT